MARSGHASFSYQFLLLATLITLAAAAIRVANLDNDSLWFDEVLTLNTAVQGLAAAGQVRDHPPLLYWLATLSLSMFPANEFALRLPSLFAGILAVPLLINFGKTAPLPAAGLWAGFLLAISPFHVRYAQEARHYALLLFFALLSLLFLYRALNNSSMRNWLIYGLATSMMLSVHFSAWLLLVAEGLVIAGWLVLVIKRSGRQALLAIWPAALVLLPALLLLVPRTLTAFSANVGDSAGAGTTAAADMLTWLNNIRLAFGLNDPVLSALFFLLVLAGAIILAYRRYWLLLCLLLAAAIVPLALIQILNVSRWALPKYVIYLLPAYLLAAGVSLETLSRRLADALPWPRRDSRSRILVNMALGLGLLFLAISPLQEEYNFMVRDWRGALSSLGGPGENDTVVALALDTADGFNAGGVVAPHYLPEGFDLIDGNHLNLKNVQLLDGREGRLSAILLEVFQPLTVTDPAWRLSEFQGPLFLLQYQGEKIGLDEQLLSLYQVAFQSAPLPETRCAMQQKIAMIYLAREDYSAAQLALDALDPGCSVGKNEREQLQTAVSHGLLIRANRLGQSQKANKIAAELLAANPKDELALNTLTVVDLLLAFESGQATVEHETADNPIEMRRFTMPQNGDWEDVLFMHAPAALSFTVELPDEPSVLQFRNALAPESWDWGGDGVTFSAVIQGQQSDPVEMYRRHISNETADRGWHPETISLADYAGEIITLTLITENGPQGDGTGDWAGWGAPRILRSAGTGE